jgi:4-hydroxybenzoate polyprenyltransferase
VVSFAWATSFSLIPVYMTGIAPGYPALTIFFFLFAWTFIASVLPDIRDRTGDAATGVITIPVLLGVRKTRILLTLVNAFALAVVLALRVGSLNQVASIVMLGSMAYSQACILGIDHQYDNILCDMISDGQFLVIGMSCAIFSILVPALW